MTTAIKLREEGKKEGKKEGIREGFKKKAIEDAKNILIDGITIEKAAQYTGLTLDEVKNLKLSIKT